MQDIIDKNFPEYIQFSCFNDWRPSGKNAGEHTSKHLLQEYYATTAEGDEAESPEAFIKTLHFPRSKEVIF